MIKMLIQKIWVTIFARPKFYRLNLFILSLTNKAIGIDNYQSYRLSGEEHFIRTILKKYNIQTVIDVGANSGGYTKLLLKRGFTGQAYLFEPNPKAIQEIPNHPQIFTYQVALSSQEGPAELYDYALTGSKSHASLHPEVIQNVHRQTPAGTFTYKITLDQFVKDNRIPRISLLKIDTEGHELEVLKGCQNLIQQNRIDIIQFEFGETSAAAGLFFREFVDLLQPKYNLFRLLPNHLLPIEYRPGQHEIFKYQNIAAIHRRI